MYICCRFVLDFILHLCRQLKLLGFCSCLIVVSILVWMKMAWFLRQKLDGGVWDYSRTDFSTSTMESARSLSNMELLVMKTYIYMFKFELFN